MMEGWVEGEGVPPQKIPSYFHFQKIFPERANAAAGRQGVLEWEGSEGPPPPKKKMGRDMPYNYLANE